MEQMATESNQVVVTDESKKSSGAPVKDSACSSTPMFLYTTLGCKLATMRTQSPKSFLSRRLHTLAILALYYCHRYVTTLQHACK